ncbi:MAG: VirB3 family type IV secretion system protein [Desulfobulbaceae bacterium]|nr:VirB3 family type IV secretion system protein [Desulfobulbaceae bacterium]
MIGRRSEGLSVTVHRSLVERILLAGIPRNVCFILWTTITSMAFGLRQLWVIPFGIGIHFVLRLATEKDPFFFEVFLQDMKNPDRFDV